ncbi:M56 family metallopeptidase [Bacilliculturomica massiliensis]|uniref:M56 family metallopeptidase n=1 Tax=Bacilliculturomica massiliensis TaxID=1917867 RepID=UPI0010305B84|nr:M56 family metallopeptidase [Bacilliculturomica massiliensis]
MEGVFLKVLNMSITAVFVILAVICLRLCLKRAPKIYSHVLWMLVLIRLLCPVSIQSALSLLPVGPETVPGHIAFEPTPQIHSGISAVDQAVSAVLPAATPYASVNPMQIYLFLAAAVWVCGVALLLSGSAWSVLRFRRQLKMAVPAGEGVYELDTVETPFVFGILRPAIYLPPGLGGKEKGYILEHERTHIRRLDHIVKPLMYLAVCIHWFNPLAWAAFALMSEDMELSCDESVIRRMGSQVKKEYSASLLALSANKRFLGGCPLAFGEKNAKGRIKNILNYRKPAIWWAVLVMAVIAAASVGLLTDRASAEPSGLPDPAGPGSASAHGQAVNVSSRLDSLFEKLMEAAPGSSAPSAYIEADTATYRAIVNDGDSALLYCFSAFEQGGQTGLKGALMEQVCRELCGEDGKTASATGQEWYEAYKEKAMRRLEEKGEAEMEKHMPQMFLLLQFLNGQYPDIGGETRLPDYSYEGDDPVLRLVYDTELYRESNYRRDGAFLVPAVRLHGTFREEDKLKVFATVYDALYTVWGEEVKDAGGSVIPAAITYVESPDGSFQLESYETAEDGNAFHKSIERFCTMPVSGRRIEGLSEKILDHYGGYEDLAELQRNNLIDHLRSCGIERAWLINAGETGAEPLF